MPPNNAASDSAVLLARLKLENLAWQSLLDVLQEEEQALIAGHADRVALLNNAKLAQLQCVSDHARGRHGELLAAGHTPDHAGMNQVMLDGMLNGLLYALVAVGLCLIWGVMDVINFAHGEYLMVAM